MAIDEAPAVVMPPPAALSLERRNDWLFFHLAETSVVFRPDEEAFEGDAGFVEHVISKMATYGATVTAADVESAIQNNQ